MQFRPETVLATGLAPGALIEVLTKVSGNRINGRSPQLVGNMQPCIYVRFTLLWPKVGIRVPVEVVGESQEIPNSPGSFDRGKHQVLELNPQDPGIMVAVN